MRSYRLPFWLRFLGRLWLLEELAVAYYRHRKRESRWWQDVWIWVCYRVISGYGAGELDHLGPGFAAIDKGGDPRPEWDRDD